MKKSINIIAFTIFLLVLLNILWAQETRQNEIVGERTHYSKTYFNENSNSFTTRISSNLEHYKSEDGTFESIDKTIRNSKYRRYDYEATKGVYKAYFKAQIDSSYPVRYETRDGLFLKLQPYALAYMDKKTKEKTIIAKITAAEPIVNGNRISYDDVFQNVDIRYSYNEKQLKEEIILKEGFRKNLASPEKYGFKDNDALLVVLNYLDYTKGLDIDEVDSTDTIAPIAKNDLKNYEKKRQLNFKKNRKIRFKMIEDIAYQESAGIESGDVEYKNQLKLTRRIMDIDGRRNLVTGIKYKKLMDYDIGDIILDPTIETNVGSNGDAYFGIAYNRGTRTYIFNGKYYAAGTTYKFRSLFRFDVSSIPSGANIINSEMNLYYYGAYPTPTSATFLPRTLEAHIVFKEWVETQVTVSKASNDLNWYQNYGLGKNIIQWQTADYCSAIESSYSFTQANWDQFGYKSFDVTNATDIWVNDPYSYGFGNQGIMLIANNEDVLGQGLKFFSRETPYTEKRPYLEVTWTREFNKNFYIKDHLGNIRVTVDSDGDVLSYNDYYPFGLQMPGRSATSGVDNNLYKYSGKELDEENGLDWYYFGARYYDPVIGRFLSVDRFADKYPSMSPYQYAANNPIKFIDVNGDSVYIFGENGEYIATFDDGKKEISGLYFQKSKTDKNGKVTHTEAVGFSFNDIDLDKKEIKSGAMKVSLITDSQIGNAMIKSGATDPGENSLTYIERESRPRNDESILSGKSNGKLDFIGTNETNIISYGNLHISGGVAYNDYDFGNFLWGQAGKQLGFGLSTLKFAAHLNNAVNGKSDNPGKEHRILDSVADQRAIRNGYYHK